MINDVSLDEALLARLVSVCEEAGKAILKVYNQTEELTVEVKADDSPVTAADLAAHQVLLGGLPGLLPELPILSEEGSLPAWDVRKAWQSYWLIDPLDGTKEFIHRNGEFTVNVALIQNGEPILGAVHVPVSGVTYSGIKGLGAWKIEAGRKSAISVSSLDEISREERPFVLVASRRHGAEAVDLLIENLEHKFGELRTDSMGSSLKLCLVAEGKADLYPRLALTSEWDTAAAQAVVEAAGGLVLNDRLEPMRYNTKENILNPWFYVIGDVSYNWSAILGKAK